MVKKVVLKNIDLYTEAGELETTAPDKRKDKCSPGEKVRRNRHRQKEVVRQLIQEFKKLSKRDEDEELHEFQEEEKKKNDRVFYTMKPVI
jgi:ribosomal protein L3